MGKLPRKFHLVNENVCVRLMLCGEDVKELLSANNWIEAPSANEADIILINSCAFMESAEEKAVSEITKLLNAKRKNQEVVVFGCLPDINPQRLREINAEGRFFSGRNLEEAINMFNLSRAERKIGHKVHREWSRGGRLMRLLNRVFLRDDYFTYLYDKEKVFHLKISEGCLGTCTYCAERLARGKLVSKPTADIMREFLCGLEEGYCIFSLNADDVGMFGQDRGESIADLLEQILAMKQDFRLVLTEFNPAALVRYEKRLFAALSSPKIIFITIPIESGSQRILNLMQRPYAMERVLPLLERIREANPRLKINTHIIVGFPGETEADFLATSAVLDKFHFNKVKIFPYSDRHGTLAHSMGGKVTEEEKIRRKKKLSHKIFWQSLRKMDLKAILLNHFGF